MQEQQIGLPSFQCKRQSWPGTRKIKKVSTTRKGSALTSLANPWILASVVIVAILTIQGFGLLLPNEIRVFQQLLSETPDIEKISRLGMRNAKLGGVQGLFQLAIIFVMANLRF